MALEDDRGFPDPMPKQKRNRAEILDDPDLEREFPEAREFPEPAEITESAFICREDPVDANPLPSLGEEWGENPTMPRYEDVEASFRQSGRLVEDIVLKKYLTRLDEFEIVPLDENLKNLSAIRFFHVNEMVYQADEPVLPQFASVFNTLQNLDCAVFLMVRSDGKKNDFYIGIRALDDNHTPKSLKDTLRNALVGHFPGVKTKEMSETAIRALTEEMCVQNNIASVSCVPKDKGVHAENEAGFVQGLEKFILAMQGQEYTMLVLAKSESAQQLEAVRHAYEEIYSTLSPFATMQLTYGENEALGISQSITSGMSVSHSTSKSTGRQWSTNESKNWSTSDGTTSQDKTGQIAKALLMGMAGIAGVIAAPATGFASFALPTALGFALGSFMPDSHTQTNTEGKTVGNSMGGSENVTDGETRTLSENITDGVSNTKGTSRTAQLDCQNKVILDTLKRLDEQLKRIDECESLGMWESGIYFLSSSREAAEMAAATYRSLMQGEKTGLETSAINVWGEDEKWKLPFIRDYLSNFLHPVFKCVTGKMTVPVTAASLISGQELAIELSLPRRSVSGLPVIVHAEFGLEAVSYAATRGDPGTDNSAGEEDTFTLGKIHSMGTDTLTELELNCQSFTSHALVCGSTGSGKSNTVYEIMMQLCLKRNIPFLVIEPAKGEYKYIFDTFENVTVYGTNTKNFGNVLKLNPFAFPDNIHVLEHMDRLVEVFSVAWPMYAAMPAILKDAMERAYEAAGWDLVESVNPHGNIFPDFRDLLRQVENVVAESRYSTDTQGDYTGALCTRIRTLTTGLNRLIFSGEGISDENLFDKNVIVDLSRLGSSETRALVMGILLLRLNEYRLSNLEPGEPLRHVTILEEAHNLLKRVSTEQNMESANVLGKAVEMLASSIAEMRAYGESFIIVDQSPNMLDQSAIRNTNTKIILRLPDQADRELVGKSANLDEKQINELSRLEQGVAAIYQNNWIQPVLARINLCKIKPRAYVFESAASAKKQISQSIYFLLTLLEPEPGNCPDPAKLPADIQTRIANILALPKTGRLYGTERRKVAALLGEIAVTSRIEERIVGLVNSSANIEEFSHALSAMARDICPVATEGQNRELAADLFFHVAKNRDDEDVRGVFKLYQDHLKRGE